MKPQHGLSFFLERLCFFVVFVVLLVAVHVSKKMDRGVGGWSLANPSFSRFLLFFST